MTREEQIHEIANTISTNIGKEIDEDYICNDIYDFTIGFESGAKWVDENPKEGLVSIDKVCKYLETNFGIELCMAFGDKFIDKLRKAMRE